MNDPPTMPHGRPATLLTDAQRQAGCIILSGMICLHGGMLLALPGLMLFEHPVGWVFVGLAKLPLMAWLPVLGFGILARLIANSEAREAALADTTPTPLDAD